MKAKTDTAGAKRQKSSTELIDASRDTEVWLMGVPIVGWEAARNNRSAHVQLSRGEQRQTIGDPHGSCERQVECLAKKSRKEEGYEPVAVT